MSTNPEIYHELAGNAISEMVNLKIKQFCFESAHEQTNLEFDECYQRLRFLNFQIFSRIMAPDTKNNQSNQNVNQSVAAKQWFLV